MPDLLQVENLAKRFGGIVATDDLSIAIPEGQLHAVIGPNGAGKTTLIAQLSGQLTPDSGRIRFAGNDITALPMPARSALGLARSFQITSLFLDLSVLDNVALAVQAHTGHSFHFWRNAREQPELRDPARAALARVGLKARENLPASALSHAMPAFQLALMPMSSPAAANSVYAPTPLPASSPGKLRPLPISAPNSRNVSSGASQRSCTPSFPYWPPNMDW